MLAFVVTGRKLTTFAQWHDDDTLGIDAQNVSMLFWSIRQMFFSNNQGDNSRVLLIVYAADVMTLKQFAARQETMAHVLNLFRMARTELHRGIFFFCLRPSCVDGTFALSTLSFVLFTSSSTTAMHPYAVLWQEVHLILGAACCV